MRADRIIQKTKEVLMTQACSLASAAAHIYFPSSRSVILPPISDYRSFVTMSEVVSLNDIAKQKKTLRSIVRKELKALSPTQRSQEDIAIQNIVLEASWFKSSKSICAYISCDSLREVNTSKILSAILYNTAEEGHKQMRKRLYVPRVEDRNSYMRMLNISSTSDLIPNLMNILEPTPLDSDGNQREDVMQATDPVDLFLVPGVAFDRSGRRLGRGGGYYDMLLKKYQDVAAEQKWKQPLLVALSYSLQIMEEGVIPVTPNDVPVDALVSPAGVIPISPAAFERM
ncbi:5-formyltetrahydrofolate cyclo-ligase, mitochondrial-like isoform X2 [Macadamia integrifolia]|uniref:5-formyltetrahydrofolate cyclo-ligase, mitochondrial-like isoform X2 n=1 Tax=Macadamia integrifolia TaxID=60698 RepID=UPI001C4E5916|nr:5-formyltetrahydrofolate cyclo-ligase, mitochondrial-like isoform X2 [Macadamia integrifolia]